MDYFIYDAKLRLFKVQEELRSGYITKFESNLLKKKEKQLSSLIKIYEGIKTNTY